MGQDYLVEHQSLLLENGTEVDLNYYMTSEANSRKVPLYGIKVEKKGDMTEVEHTGPISYSSDWVLQLCKKMAGNQVTPISLLSIIDDIVTE